MSAKKEKTNKKNSSKGCRGRRNAMLAYVSIRLTASLISAISLISIAFGLIEVNKKSSYFNDCVESSISNGNRDLEAVRFCNGGN